MYIDIANLPFKFDTTIHTSDVKVHRGTGTRDKEVRGWDTCYMFHPNHNQHSTEYNTAIYIYSRGSDPRSKVPDFYTHSKLVQSS